MLAGEGLGIYVVYCQALVQAWKGGRFAGLKLSNKDCRPRSHMMLPITHCWRQDYSQIPFLEDLRKLCFLPVTRVGPISSLATVVCCCQLTAQLTCPIARCTYS